MCDIISYGIMFHGKYVGEGMVQQDSRVGFNFHCLALEFFLDFQPETLSLKLSAWKWHTIQVALKTKPISRNWVVTYCTVCSGILFSVKFRIELPDILDLSYNRIEKMKDRSKLYLNSSRREDYSSQPRRDNSHFPMDLHLSPIISRHLPRSLTLPWVSEAYYKVGHGRQRSRSISRSRRRFSTKNRSKSSSKSRSRSPRQFTSEYSIKI